MSKMRLLIAATLLGLSISGVGGARAQQADQYITNDCYGCAVTWHAWSDDGYAHWTNTCYNGGGCDGWVLVYP